MTPEICNLHANHANGVQTDSLIIFGKHICAKSHILTIFTPGLNFTGLGNFPSTSIVFMGAKSGDRAVTRLCPALSCLGSPAIHGMRILIYLECPSENALKLGTILPLSYQAFIFYPIWDKVVRFLRTLSIYSMGDESSNEMKLSPMREKNDPMREKNDIWVLFYFFPRYAEKKVFFPPNR